MTKIVKKNFKTNTLRNNSVVGLILNFKFSVRRNARE